MPAGDSAHGASRQQILRATLWAALAAALIVVTVVLPAEYGMDPTGFGKLTGISALAATVAVQPANVAVPGPAVHAATAWATEHVDKYVTHRYEITMQGDEEFEYKANMNRGDSLLYSWRVKEGSQLYFEFHGEPTSGTWPKDYFESYQKGEAAGGQGTLVAPFTGHHGWYWLNLSEKPVTIVVELTGYYSQFGKVGAPPTPPDR
jgi:hypothetical protein